MYKDLQEVPVDEIEAYYTQIEGALDIAAWEDACEQESPGSPDFDDLQWAIFEELVEEAMKRQFIGDT